MEALSVIGSLIMLLLFLVASLMLLLSVYIYYIRLKYNHIPSPKGAT